MTRHKGEDRMQNKRPHITWHPAPKVRQGVSGTKGSTMRLSIFHTIIVTLAIMVSTSGMAELQNEVSIKYLKAAIGSITNNAKVLVRGAYGGNLESATRWEGNSMFNIRDNDGKVFSYMVCKTNGDVFKRLLDTTVGTQLLLSCQKYKLGYVYDDCLLVLDFRAADMQKTTPADASSKDKYKVTITSTNGSQTVVTNVALDAQFQAGSLRITIEKEKGR